MEGCAPRCQDDADAIHKKHNLRVGLVRLDEQDSTPDWQGLRMAPIQFAADFQLDIGARAGNETALHRFGVGNAGVDQIGRLKRKGALQEIGHIADAASCWIVAGVADEHRLILSRIAN